VVDKDGGLGLQTSWTSRELVSPVAPIVINGVMFALSSGEYFFHKILRAPNPAAKDERLQRGLLDACARLSGISLER